jgi:hypothetical protein
LDPSPFESARRQHGNTRPKVHSDPAQETCGPANEPTATDDDDESLKSQRECFSRRSLRTPAATPALPAFTGEACTTTSRVAQKPNRRRRRVASTTTTSRSNSNASDVRLHATPSRRRPDRMRPRRPLCCLRGAPPEGGVGVAHRRCPPLPGSRFRLHYIPNQLFRFVNSWLGIYCENASMCCLFNALLALPAKMPQCAACSMRCLRCLRGAPPEGGGAGPLQPPALRSLFPRRFAGVPQILKISLHGLFKPCKGLDRPCPPMP